MTYEERIAQNPQWREDAAFLGRAIFEFRMENLPRIRRIIETYPGKARENRENRQYGYLALVRHLKHFPDPEYMRWHIGQILKETDKYILSSMLDEIANWPYLPPDTEITPLLVCTKSEKWLIYQGAIEALSICDCEEARQAVRPFLQWEPVRKNEPIYGDLGRFFARVGTPEDLPVLEELYARANRNIRVNLEYAISGIKERYQNGESKR